MQVKFTSLVPIKAMAAGLLALLVAVGGCRNDGANGPSDPMARSKQSPVPLGHGTSGTNQINLVADLSAFNPLPSGKGVFSQTRSN